MRVTVGDGISREMSRSDKELYGVSQIGTRRSYIYRPLQRKSTKSSSVKRNGEIVAITGF